MKIIHRKILIELSTTFLLGIISLNFILMMEKLLRLSRMLSTVGASVSDMAGIILYIQPQLLIFTVPMSMLVSILLTYGRLNADNEITVLRSSGMSFAGMARPVFLLGGACFIGGLLITFYIAPAGAIKLRKAVTETITERAPLAIEAGVFNAAFKDVIVNVREKPPGDVLKGIFVYDGKSRRAMFAREGTLSGGKNYSISFRLRDGMIHIARGVASTTVSFGTYNLLLPLSLETPSRKIQELSPPALLKEAQAKNDRGKTRLLLEFHRRLTLPAVCLLLMFLGPPLALISGKRGRLGGLTLGLLTFALYYSMLIYGENLAMSGIIPHLAGAWASFAALGLAALLSFRKAGLR